MTATNPKLAKFRYKHGDPLVPDIVAFGLAAGVGAVVLAGMYTEHPLIMLAAFAAVAVAFWKWPRRRILLTPRYLVCGHTIVYYANVKRMVLDPGRSLSLFWGEKQRFTIECQHFPTNARKSHKIAANKLAKFEKVTEKVMKHVMLYSPAVELAGIERETPAQKEAAA